ncbi:MAG: D-alanyl-D-alanine carboxypeptidase [Gorillibacterium sp.]|nr:D-alanyl-D-alanine carboxypeptidase [Gorillibacterium sp.]
MVLSLSLVVPLLPIAHTNVYAASAVKVNAKAAILIDAESGQVLYENNADTPLPPASMAKMMTEYIVMEKIRSGEMSWDQMVPVSRYAANVGGSGGLLAENEQLSIKDMLYALSIYSSNDASVALAEFISGSEAAFANLMNETAAQIGLADTTHFTSATGLARDDLQEEFKNNPLEGDTLITARDVAKLGYTLIKNDPMILEFTKIPSKKLREKDQFPMINWNWMLEANVNTAYQKQFAYPGLDGLKTGSTDAAGYCFTGTAVRNGMRLISVVMNATPDGVANPTSKQREASRFTETRKLLDYGFNNFEPKTVVKKDIAIDTLNVVKVKKGVKKTVSVVTGGEVSMILEKGAKESDIVITTQAVDESKLVAPLAKGTEVGTLTVKYKGTEKVIKLVTTEDVKKGSWFRLFFRGIGNFFSGIGSKIKGLF